MSEGSTRSPSLPVLRDAFARTVRYLRVSLTDRCNYRCVYCMPEEGVDLVPRADVLSFEEIERIVRVMMRFGVRRVRLTGGEPTIRPDLERIVTLLRQVPELEDLSLSTNGVRFCQDPTLAARLRKPLSSRLFPVPGKKAGDIVSFNDPVLTGCRVFDIA